MDPWTLGLVAVVVLGVGLIVYGALRDRSTNARARAEMLAPPNRDIPQFRPDTPAPQYLSELQARRRPADAVATPLAEEDREALRTELQTSAVVVDAGYRTKAFVTDPGTGWAVLDEPTILVCSAPVASIRELLPLMERAALARRSLVIAAPSIAADVLGTLEVNVIQQKLRLLAVTTDKHNLATIAAHTGARPLDRGDLQSGYTPAEHLGRCARWVADHRQSWIVPEATAT